MRCQHGNEWRYGCHACEAEKERDALRAQVEALTKELDEAVELRDSILRQSSCPELRARVAKLEVVVDAARALSEASETGSFMGFAEDWEPLDKALAALDASET